MSQNLENGQPTVDTDVVSKPQTMSISVVIGFTISVIGLIILLTGLFGHPDLSRSDHMNFDLWWGLLMFVFGLTMGGGSYLLAQSKLKKLATH